KSPPTGVSGTCFTPRHMPRFRPVQGGGQTPDARARMTSVAVEKSEPRLTNRQLLAALRAFRRGDFSVRLPRDLTGMDGDIAEAFNGVVVLNEHKTREFSRLAELVGKQGKINHRARLPAATGAWADSVDAVNNLVEDLI